MPELKPSESTKNTSYNPLSFDNAMKTKNELTLEVITTLMKNAMKDTLNTMEDKLVAVNKKIESENHKLQENLLQ